MPVFGGQSKWQNFKKRARMPPLLILCFNLSYFKIKSVERQKFHVFGWKKLFFLRANITFEVEKKLLTNQLKSWHRCFLTIWLFVWGRGNFLKFWCKKKSWIWSQKALWIFAHRIFLGCEPYWDGLTWELTPKLFLYPW